MLLIMNRPLKALALAVGVAMMGGTTALASTAAASSSASKPQPASAAVAGKAVATTAKLDESQLRDRLKGTTCLACHAPDRKLVGPSFADIAKRYAAKNTDVAMLAARVRKGSSGIWGAIPMPASPQLSEAQSIELVQAVLAYSPAPAAK